VRSTRKRLKGFARLRRMQLKESDSFFLIATARERKRAKDASEHLRGAIGQRKAKSAVFRFWPSAAVTSHCTAPHTLAD